MYRNVLFILLFLSATSLALDFQEIENLSYAEADYQGVSYTLIKADPQDVVFLWKDKDSQALNSLANAKKYLENTDHAPLFIMNASIYSKNYQPAGLWIEEGIELHKLNQSSGAGNFHIKPSGIFYISNSKAHIMLTETWQKLQLNADYALQSGPMLLIDGVINPRFSSTIDSPYKRNAVCTNKAGELFFVISTHYQDKWPNFYQFAEALKSFNCWQALYLDGGLSDYYLLGKRGTFHLQRFVGMIAVTKRYNSQIQ